jgi:predicted metal-dependent hydrolase
VVQEARQVRQAKGRRQLRVARQARLEAVSARRSSDGSLALARRLRTRLATTVDVDLTDNTYTMISFSRRQAAYCLRLHHMFLDAEDHVLDALSSYVRGDDRRASAVLDAFIQKNRRRIRQISPRQKQQRLLLNAQGQHYDLASLLDDVQEQCFGDLIRDVAIAWAPAPQVALPRRSIKLGSYSADTQIIRIHPALDQPAVPEFFVRWIIYHELLHHIFRADLKARNGRVHTPEFCRLERQFPEYREALLWERRHLDTLLWWEPPPRALRATGS